MLCITSLLRKTHKHEISSTTTYNNDILWIQDSGAMKRGRGMFWVDVLFYVELAAILDYLAD